MHAHVWYTAHVHACIYWLQYTCFCCPSECIPVVTSWETCHMASLSVATKFQQRYAYIIIILWPLQWESAEPYNHIARLSSVILHHLTHKSGSNVLSTFLQTSVLVPLYTMGRLHDNFPNANVFDPGRWSKESRAHKPFAYLPFGFGPRACYGETCMFHALCMQFKYIRSS